MINVSQDIGEFASARLGGVLERLRCALGSLPSEFAINHTEAGMILSPEQPGLVVSVFYDSGRFILDFNDVPFETDSAEEALFMIRRALEGQLRVVTRRKAGKVVSATLETALADGEWSPMAGYGRSFWLFGRGVETLVARNAVSGPPVG